jgi:hypothetical protein
MALAMTVITNVGIRGYLPRTMCLICLTLMWMESALGLCLGCKIYGLLLQRRWIGVDADIEVCADGSCERSTELTNDADTRVSSLASGVVAAAAVGVLLAFASPAVAQLSASAALHRIGPSVRFWSVSKIEQGVGKKLIKQDVQQKGKLLKAFDLGRAAFNFPVTEFPDRASGEVSSSGDGLDSQVFAQAPVLDPFTPRSAKGGVAHLDEYQTYEKQPGAGGASLRITISGLSLETEDANGPLTVSECPPPERCDPIRTIVRYHAYVHKVGEAHDFYDFGGAVYTEGHQHAWFVGAATAADSQGPFWGKRTLASRATSTGTTPDRALRCARLSGT